MNASIRLEAEIYTDDRTGEFFVRYTPVLKAGITATGELRFAAWQCRLLAGPDAHIESMRDALASARHAMHTMAREVAV